MPVITIPNNLIRKKNLVAVDKKSYEKIINENKELKSALKAVVKGEIDLRLKRTKSLEEFLSERFSRK